MSEAARWIIAAVFAIPGISLVFFNWFRFWVMYQRRKRGVRRFISGLGFAGPVFLTLAMLAVPVGTVGQRARWIWVVWVIDNMTLLFIAFLVMLMIQTVRRK